MTAKDCAALGQGVITAPPFGTLRTSHLSACVSMPAAAPGELIFRICTKGDTAAVVDHADPVIWLSEPMLGQLAARENLPSWLLRSVQLRLPDKPEGSKAGLAIWPRSTVSSLFTAWHGVQLVVDPWLACSTLRPYADKAPQRLVYRITHLALDHKAGFYWRAEWPD